METQFFALDMKPGKVYKQVVSRPFRLSMAAFAAHAGDKAISNTNARTSVVLKTAGEEITLVNLIPEKVENQIMDVMFGMGESISFYIKGTNPVSLTGNYLPEPDDGEMDSEEEREFQEIMKARMANGAVDSDDDEDEEKANAEAEEDSDDDATAEPDTTITSMGSMMEEDSDESDEEEAEPKAQPPPKKQKVDAHVKGKPQHQNKSDGKKEHGKSPQKPQQKHQQKQQQQQQQQQKGQQSHAGKQDRKRKRKGNKA